MSQLESAAGIKIETSLNETTFPSRPETIVSSFLGCVRSAPNFLPASLGVSGLLMGGRKVETCRAVAGRKTFLITRKLMKIPDVCRGLRRH